MTSSLDKSDTEREHIEWQQRTELMLGHDACKRLQAARVLLVGTGGVGAYAAEMLVRAGLGAITLIDADRVAPSNINRQIIALHSTIDQAKVQVLASRLRDINPELEIDCKECFVEPEDVCQILREYPYDFVLDAIDTLAPKTELLVQCHKLGLAVISSMGAGAKLRPDLILQADISKTYSCSLAKALRKRLKERGVYSGIAVIFSSETVISSAVEASSKERNKRSTLGTVSYMPALFGCHMAAYVISKLSNEIKDKQ